MPADSTRFSRTDPQSGDHQRGRCNEGMHWYEVVPVAAVVGATQAAIGHRDQTAELYKIADKAGLLPYDESSVLLVFCLSLSPIGLLTAYPKRLE